MLVKVQVMTSPGWMLIAVMGLPSLHVALVRSQPATVASETE